jgi:hypothetical protein
MSHVSKIAVGDTSVTTLSNLRFSPTLLKAAESEG